MEETKNKGKMTKYILFGSMVVALVSIGAYYFATRSKDQDDGESDNAVRNSVLPSSPPPPPPPPAPVRQTSSYTNYGSGGFPLKLGSRGTYVTQLQNALINRYGRSILPNYGADGDWGSETQSAMTSKGLPTYIDSLPFFQAILVKIAKKKTSSNSSTTQSSSTSSGGSKDNIKSVDRAQKIANYIRYGIKKNDFKNVNYLLSLLHTIGDYSSVNGFFKVADMHDGTKRTLVNGLFKFFKDDYYRELIRKHLYRMGLKKKNGKWSLSGIPNVLYDQIKVIRKAKVWNAKKQSMQVPENTILGEFISAQHGVTKFKTIDGKMLFTSTDNVRYV